MSDTDIPDGHYGFPGPLRDLLVAAILDGSKRSTTSLLEEFRRDDEPLPEVGYREAVLDSDGRRVCVTRVTDVVICRLADVTVEHARLEGEGHETVADWRRDHEAFWHSREFVAAMGDPPIHIDDDTEAVCVRFAVERVLGGDGTAG